MNKSDCIIAIDPDVDKSGVAELRTGNRLLGATSLTFPQLLEYLQFVKREIITAQGLTVTVVVEAGWLNAISNYHTKADRKGQRIARNVGSNQQVGKIIVEMCRHYEIPVETIKPLKKMWKGKDGKITHEELAVFTGITGQTNQEERDAALIAWVYAGLPIKINNNKQ
jgi:hypothetical protein